MGPACLAGSYETGNVPSPGEPPSLAGRSAGTDRELQRKVQHRQSLPPHCTSQPEMHVCCCAQCLGSETQLKLEQTDLERGLGLAAQRQPEGPGVWSRPQLGMCTGWRLGLP